MYLIIEHKYKIYICADWMTKVQLIKCQYTEAINMSMKTIVCLLGNDCHIDIVFWYVWCQYFTGYNKKYSYV